uniref:E3 ubiquitin-protein ligase MYLIP-B n=1 Tax=Drosophila rhopaloa TaxID=1041015 RepID=A0A6P4DYB7_DRORH
MSLKSAKYWLLQSIQDLEGYGEELFSGVTTNESAQRCDIAVGAHGITAAIERCVDTRISEAMQCKICMDRAINTVFNPCCHVIACAQCAARCSNCPNCRVKITSVVKIYLPPELRTSQTGSGATTTSSGSGSDGPAMEEQLHQLEEISVAPATSLEAGAGVGAGAGATGPGGQPKVTTAA